MCIVQFVRFKENMFLSEVIRVEAQAQGQGGAVEQGARAGLEIPAKRSQAAQFHITPLSFTLHHTVSYYGTHFHITPHSFT